MNNDLYQLALDKWGVDVQLTVVMEELSELIKEVCKLKRNNGHLDHLAEEIADVEIMCEQLRYIYNLDSSVDYWKKSKLLRLENRLK
jgi:NTP pyrophosphatase (non-canonical NTP hydrolase)